MDKEKLIKAIQAKGLHNSLISIYYNIGRALPFRAQRFPDGRVSSWYQNQFVEVHSVKPSGKGGKYGDAFGFYFRNGVREDPYDNPEFCWCKKDSEEPGLIPNGACGSWVLLDILGEPTAEPTKVYGLKDFLDFGKYKGETLETIIHNDFNWVEWAINNSEHFFCDIDAVTEERKKDIRVLNPEDTLPFGKYMGQTLRSVFSIDPSYISWLSERTSDYIIDLNALHKLKIEELLSKK